MLIEYYNDKLDWHTVTGNLQKKTGLETNRNRKSTGPLAVGFVSAGFRAPHQPGASHLVVHFLLHSSQRHEAERLHRARDLRPSIRQSIVVVYGVSKKNAVTRVTVVKVVM